MKDKELVSNCCGARIDGFNGDNMGRCSECGEGCGMETVTFEPGAVKFEDLKDVINGKETMEDFLSKLNQK
jgi:hypothetical protein